MATWPGRSSNTSRLHRPHTVTLERPSVLDVSLVGEIDMSLIPKKGLLTVSNLCITPVKKGVGKSKGDRGREGAKSSWEEARSSVSERPKPNKLSRVNKVLKERVKRSPSKSHRNNKEGEGSKKTCKRPVIVKKGSVKNCVDEVLAGPKLKVEVPEPCRTCGRSEQPERFHSHPATPASKKPPTDSNKPPTTKSAAIKSSVRKPVSINYKGRRRQSPETAVRIVVEDHGCDKSALRRRAVVCYLCGREFSTSSYPFHEPDCLQRWQRDNEELPVHLRRPEVVRPSRPFTVDQWNQFAWESSQASLVPCENCGRTFAPDRLEVHLRSCKTPLPGAPRKLALQQYSYESQAAASRPQITTPPSVHCSMCGRVFGTTKSISIHEPQCLDKWKQKNSKLTPFHKTPEPLRPNSGACARTTVNCYLCGREFGSLSITIHEPQCLNKWHLENSKLPTHQRRPEPNKPDIRFTAAGKVDYQGTMDAIWQSHLEQLVPCGACSRTFMPDRLPIHERSCKGPK